MGKYCPQCGQKTRDTARFCHKCGHTFSRPEDQVTRVMEPVDQIPPAPLPVTPPQGGPKKRTALWISIGSIAAAAVIAAVLVIFLVVLPDSEKKDTNGNGNGNGPGTSSTKPPPPPTTDETPPVTGLDDLVFAAYASSTLPADTRESDSGPITYEPDNLFDDDRSTCWAEGVPGYGEGEYFEFDFDEPVYVTEVEAVPGYDKFYKIDRWEQNGKLKKVELEFSNGENETVEFQKDRRLQIVKLSRPFETDSVGVTILETYPGEGSQAADDTSVSEFRFRGYTVADYEELNDVDRQ